MNEGLVAWAYVYEILVVDIYFGFHEITAI